MGHPLSGMQVGPDAAFDQGLARNMALVTSTVPSKAAGQAHVY
jgi:hypothetical protein